MHPSTSWLIIDGYSLLHRDKGSVPASGEDLHVARHKLIRKIEGIVQHVAGRTTIVFDGKHGGRDVSIESESIEVLFSPGHQTADTVVERLVHAHPRPDEILVVTSDRLERETVMAAGAHVMSCATFLEVGEAKTSRAARYPRKPSTDATLGDFFPAEKD